MGSLARSVAGDAGRREPGGGGGCGRGRDGHVARAAGSRGRAQRRDPGWDGGAVSGHGCGGHRCGGGGAATSQGAQARAGRTVRYRCGCPCRYGYPCRAGRTAGRPSQALQSAQGMMGPMMSAPSMAASSMGQLLSQAQQLPSRWGAARRAAVTGIVGGRRRVRRAAEHQGLGVSGTGRGGRTVVGSRVAAAAVSPGADPR